jgi:Na+-translocating ferredoxin:NAD+ oxidoreductase RNF subunit RnfB
LGITKSIIVTVFLLSGVLLGILSATTTGGKRLPEAQDTLYTFQKDVLPLLQTNCNPCHFPGGKMYAKLPFDDSVTVARLGKRLNSRLKETEQQNIINSWVEGGTKKK